MNPPEAVQKMIELSDDGRKFRASGWCKNGACWVSESLNGVKHATDADQDLWTFALVKWLIGRGYPILPCPHPIVPRHTGGYKCAGSEIHPDIETAAIAAAEAVIGKGEG